VRFDFQSGDPHHTPDHGLQALIDEKIKELEAHLCGLDLKDFVEKKVDS